MLININVAYTSSLLIISSDDDDDDDDDDDGDDEDNHSAFDSMACGLTGLPFKERDSDEASE